MLELTSSRSDNISASEASPQPIYKKQTNLHHFQVFKVDNNDLSQQQHLEQEFLLTSSLKTSLSKSQFRSLDDRIKNDQSSLLPTQRLED